MVFLMNDVVLRPSADGFPLGAAALDRLELDWILKQGAALFAAEPDLPRTRPQTAERLVVLIAAKRIEVNAAWFNTGEDPCAVRLGTLRREALADLDAA